MRHTFLLIASIFLLAACSTKTEYPAEFAVADSLADYGEPRKALALLDSMSVGFESWAEPVQMRYSLLGNIHNPVIGNINKGPIGIDIKARSPFTEVYTSTNSLCIGTCNLFSHHFQ